MLHKRMMRLLTALAVLLGMAAMATPAAAVVRSRSYSNMKDCRDSFRSSDVMPFRPEPRKAGTLPRNLTVMKPPSRVIFPACSAAAQIGESVL